MAMAGEVTRRQPNLRVAAEDPPSFLGAGPYRIGREKAKAEADNGKACNSNSRDKTVDKKTDKTRDKKLNRTMDRTDMTTALASKEASPSTKA